MEALGRKDEPITINMHHKGVLTSQYAANPVLQAKWNVLATSLDRNGTEYIAMIEGREQTSAAENQGK